MDDGRVSTMIQAHMSAEHRLSFITACLAVSCSAGAFHGLPSPLPEDGLTRQAARVLLQQDASSSLCGAAEYLCGDSDIVLDQAYTASQSANCTLDTGMLY